MKHIIAEFSGWAKITAGCAVFENVTNPGHTITGEQYFNLPEEHKEDFVIQDLITFIRECDDNDWVDITVIEEC